MSHTTELGNGWIAIHDGDLRNSADIIMMKNKIVNGKPTTEHEIEVPFEVIEKLVAKAIVDRKISILEDMLTDEVLYK